MCLPIIVTVFVICILVNLKFTLNFGLAIHARKFNFDCSKLANNLSYIDTIDQQTSNAQMSKIHDTKYQCINILIYM